MSITLENEPSMEPAQRESDTVTSQPVRVCYVIDNLNVAGTERHVLSLIERLDRSKVVPHLCLLNGQTELSRELLPTDCEVLCLGVQSLKSLHGFTAAKKFVCWLRSRKIEVLQAYFPDSTYFSIPLAKLAGVPVRLRTRRNAGYWVTAKHRFLGSIISRITTATIANSEAGKLSVIKDERAKAESVFVIPNGVDLSRFQLKKNEEPQNEESVRIGVVANLRPIKNLQLLVQSAAELVKKHGNVLFQIAGEGPSRDELQAEIDRLGLQDRFQLLGAISDIPEFLNSLDVAVLCSLSEGMSNAVIEYKATGLPIVVTDVGGNSQLIQDQVNGLLVPSNDKDAMTRSLERLITDRGFAEQLGKAARLSVEQSHSAEAEIANYEQLYFDLCKKSSSAGFHRSP